MEELPVQPIEWDILRRTLNALTLPHLFQDLVPALQPLIADYRKQREEELMLLSIPKQRTRLLEWKRGIREWRATTDAIRSYYFKPDGTAITPTSRTRRHPGSYLSIGFELSLIRAEIQRGRGKYRENSEKMLMQPSKTDKDAASIFEALNAADSSALDLLDQHLSFELNELPKAGKMPDVCIKVLILNLVGTLNGFAIAPSYMKTSAFFAIAAAVVEMAGVAGDEVPDWRSFKKHYVSIKSNIDAILGK